MINYLLMDKEERVFYINNSLPPLSALLDYIEKGCQQINEKRNFVDYLLSMEKASSLDELINKFNNVFKLLCNINFKDKRTPKDWYFYKHWTNRNYVEILLCYLNENILSLYKRQGDYSKKQFNKFLINLRNCKNRKIIEQEILNISHKKYNSRLYNLINNKSELHKIRGGYFKYESKHLDYYTTLVGNDYILDEIDTQINQIYGYDQEYLMENYIFTEKEKRKKAIKGIANIILAFIVLAPIFYLFIKIGFFGLIIIIGFLGLVPKILLTGKI